MLVKEQFLLLAEDPLVLKEPVEDLEGIVDGVLGTCEDIILVPSGRVGEVDVGLCDFIESFLGSKSIGWVLVRVVL